MIHRKSIPLLALTLILPSLAVAQTKSGNECPMMSANKKGSGHASECPMMSAHHKDVNQRGDHVMGFSHEKTTHHFRLYPDGGAIEVLAHDAEDTASRDQIRAHLSHVAQMFSAGDFNAPMLIHDRVPPGVPEMKRLKDEISYQYAETEGGGRVRIITPNPEAVKAIHEFLRFQISDHATGDSLEVDESKH
jgi:hypothetical protein